MTKTLAQLIPKLSFVGMDLTKGLTMPLTLKPAHELGVSQTFDFATTPNVVQNDAADGSRDDTKPVSESTSHKSVRGEHLSSPVLVIVDQVGISNTESRLTRYSMDVRHAFTGRKGGMSIIEDSKENRRRVHMYFMAHRANHFAGGHYALVFDDEVRWRS